MRSRVLVATFAAILLLGGCGANAVHPSGAKSQSTSPTQGTTPKKPTQPPKIPRTGNAAPSRLVRGTPASMQALPGTLPGLTLTDADFASAQDGWISGGYGGQVGGPSLSDGIVARTTDGGGSWQVARLPGLVPTQVLFANAETGFAVASHVGEPTAGAIPGPFGLPEVNLVLRSGDGGRSWTTVLNAGGDVTGLTSAPSGKVWAAASGSCSNGECSGKILAASQAPGASWSTLWTAPGAVLAVTTQGQQAWAVVGSGDGKVSTAQVYTSTDGGKHWTKLATLPTADELSFFPDPSQLHAQVAFTGNQDGWVTLYSMESCAMHGCGVSDVYRTTDGGRTWTKDTTPTISCEFQPVLAASGQEVAVGQGVNLGACQGPEATIFLSQDGGGTFKVAQRWQNLGVGALGFVPGGGMWTLGNSALAIESADGTWHQTFPALAPLGSIDFVNAADGFGAGDALDPGAILRTNDGGRTWQAISTISNLGVNALDFPTPQDGYLNAVSIDAEGHVSELLRTTDGGRTWRKTHAPPTGGGGTPTTLTFFSANTGLFLDLQGVCDTSCTPEVGKTPDGGQTWQVSRFGSMPYYPQDASVLGPNRYVVASSNSGNVSWLGETTDSGKTWTTLATLPIRSGTLQTDFPTPEVGYLLAFVFKTPGQPGKYELLTTSDGGKTWTQHAFTTSMQFGGTPATIDFLNAKQGWLLNGSALWSTEDGGLTWTEVHALAALEP